MASEKSTPAREEEYQIGRSIMKGPRKTKNPTELIYSCSMSPNSEKLKKPI